MQETERIDITQIPNQSATEDNPITLHIGNLAHCPSYHRSISQQFSRGTHNKNRTPTVTTESQMQSNVGFNHSYSLNFSRPYLDLETDVQQLKPVKRPAKILSIRQIKEVVRQTPRQESSRAVSKKKRGGISIVKDNKRKNDAICAKIELGGGRPTDAGKARVRGRRLELSKDWY